MSAGDALFPFKYPALFGSKYSDHSRWALICCYNTRSNDPFKESHHPGILRSKVDDDMVLKVGRDDARRSSVAFANLVEEDQREKPRKRRGLAIHSPTPLPGECSPNADRNPEARIMKLGIINSAFGQAGVDTKTGLEHIPGLDSTRWIFLPRR